MKKTIRILSVALVAVMVLSLSAVALADMPSVYIPTKGTKLVLPDLPMDFPLLKTKSNDEVIKLQFSEQPDSATVNWGSPTWTPEVLDVNASGYAEVDREGHPVAPGKWVWNENGYCDEDGNPVGGHATGDAFAAYTATKGNVTVGYGTNGVQIWYVSVKVEDDFYRTGIEGAETVVTWKPVFLGGNDGGNVCFWSDVLDIQVDLLEHGCDPDNFWYVLWDQYSGELSWYVDSIVTTYPAGNPIARIESTRRNDKTNSLIKYIIDYPASETVTYRISYDSDDSVIGGEYRVNGVTKLTTGSKKWIAKWFGDRTKARASKLPGLKAATSFKSPRIK